MSETLTSALSSDKKEGNDDSIIESLIKKTLIPSESTGAPSILTPGIPDPNVFFSLLGRRK